MHRAPTVKTLLQRNVCFANVHSQAIRAVNGDSGTRLGKKLAPGSYTHRGARSTLLAHVAYVVGTTEALKRVKIIKHLIDQYFVV